MPFCPKCGREVSEDDIFCPNCGENLKKPGEAVGPRAPEVGYGATDNLNLAFNLASKKPMVFAPAIVGSLISIALSGLASLLAGASFWQFTSGAWWSNLLNWPAAAALVFTVVILSIIGGVISYVLLLASIDMSRDAYLDRPLDLGESVNYTLGRIGTFILASIIGIIFTATIILIPVAILMFVILVVDEAGIGESVSRSFNVLGRRLGDVIILLLITIVGNVILNLIPVIGGLLATGLNVVIGIAFIDLYFRYKRTSPA